MAQAKGNKNIIVAGYLNKEKSSDFASLIGGWNRRWFTFDGVYLYYYQDKDSFGPSGCVPLTDIRGVKALVEIPGFIFQVFSGKRNFKLQAFNENDRNRWVIALQNAINKRDRELEKDQEEMKQYKAELNALAHAVVEGEQATDEGEVEAEAEAETEGEAEQMDAPIEEVQVVAPSRRTRHV